MKKEYVFIAIFLIILIGGYLLCLKYLPKVKKEDPLLQKLELLEVKLDSLSEKRDSIRTIIVTVDKEIIREKEKYYETVNNIITEPSYMDTLFISEYIKKFIDERLSDD